ncbi:ABC-type Zn2+ transport system, periplasmic component/surface adhesin [Desulfuromonas soudanensis]|uniref:ABC-type Zn2+ transport system, periplasmic component/surface adhesin n=1 Tax=Desulfuromonas soudanensis TaxID=1603606 RepID=A0A0M4D263_9BACT|nr:zinc ABC transporter substrate-binding protein [Desulfuromonas soudanensis]ALC17302.1 ABC-type Zn2+ transport system, periplasmic component/surface adhesin [Desulfuromonas soudanensis]
MKKTPLIVLFLLLLAAPGISAWAEAPRVVVSLKPLHALVAGVMAGVGEPQLLIQGGGSPHGYTLRPSEARMLSEAQLVVWVGPGLETFLGKSLSTLAGKARLLELSRELKAEMLPVREGGFWETHPSEDEHGPGVAGGPGHDLHGERNQHLWLDPLLAKRIVARTTSALTDIDPVHAKEYQQNAARLQTRLDTLHAELKARLAPVKSIPYIVFHDAYQYFEAAYGLSAVGSVTLSVDRKPGARRIEEIREKIRELNARCVFSEPQFEPRLVATVIEGTGARTGILDPLGAALPSGEESYFQLMNDLADNLLAGLQ